VVVIEYQIINGVVYGDNFYKLLVSPNVRGQQVFWVLAGVEKIMGFLIN
jgi:hypothetical protein